MSEILQYLEALDPAALNYTEWVQCGMALKEEGYPVSVWDHWSERDPARYKEGECSRKWETFHGSGDIVTGGTIFQICKDKGLLAKADFMDWDDIFIADSGADPVAWHPGQEIRQYLEALFKPSEIVNIVTRSFQDKDGKYKPRGCGHNFKVSDLLARLKKYGDDLGAAIGDYDKAAGAWIRFNPMDGKGIKNENVADYRFALVESDDLSINEQGDLIRKLNLPVAALVHSGGKSLHAIVRIDAEDRKTYDARVKELYAVCKENGFVIDEQNKNPSRLSRLPGCERNGKRQRLIKTNAGASWESWKGQDARKRDPPEFEEQDLLSILEADLPPIQFIIPGLLPEGVSVLSAKPKHGKSFLALNLALCVALGKPFMGYSVNQCHVLYFDIDNADVRVTKERAAKMLSDEDRRTYSHEIRHNISIISKPKSDDLKKRVEKIGEGFEQQLTRRLSRDPELKLVIIDVLQQIRAEDKTHKKEYAADYAVIDALKGIPAKYPGVAILLVTHDTKFQNRGDFTDSISGSTGLTGSLSGSILGITKTSREDEEAVLNIESRLCKGAVLKIRFNESNLTWECLGDNAVVEKTRKAEQFKDDYKNSPVVKTIKKGLELMGDPYETTITKMLESAIYWKTGLYGMTSQKVGREIERYTAALAFDGITITKKRTSGGRERIISFTTKEADLDDWSESGKEEE